jgi:hypothetical protein
MIVSEPDLGYLQSEFRAAALLPDAERIIRVRPERWIDHPLVRAVLSELQKMVDQPLRGRVLITLLTAEACMCSEPQSSGPCPHGLAWSHCPWPRCERLCQAGMGQRSHCWHLPDAPGRTGCPQIASLGCWAPRVRSYFPEQNGHFPEQ